MADTFAYLLNQMFPDGLADATYRDPKNTFLALMKKDTKANGSLFEVAIQTTAGGGRSADFAVGKANNNGGTGKRFAFDYKNDYSWARIDAKDMAAARAGGGVVPALEHAMKNTMRNIKRSLASAVAGDGSGRIGKISAIPPTTAAGTFRLNDWRDLVHFQVGMYLETNPTRTGSAGTIRAGRALVTGVSDSRTDPRIAFTAEGGWAPVVDDFVYAEGDYDAKIQGIQAWIPVVAPTVGDSFGGVDRSTNPRQLAGIRVDVSGEATHTEALLSSGEEFQVYTAETTHVILSPADWIQLEREQEEKKRLVNVENEYKIGIVGLQLEDGSIAVCDPYFPKGFAYRVNIDTWTLMSMGDAPHLANEDGLKMLRVSDADAFEAMMRYWANLKCDAPDENGVVTLPAI